MAYKDLPEFARALEERDLLKRISVEVDPILEITEITDRVVKDGGPALMFENVKGSPYPVLINAFGTFERMRLALEVDDLDSIARRIKRLIRVPDMRSVLDKLKVLPLLQGMAGVFPRQVNRAPVQEVIEERPDLTRLPVLKCWPQDGGRFFTLPLVITRDPDTGHQNVGMYRMQLFDATTTGMHWHPHKDGAYHYQKYKRRGERMEVAVALGADPAMIYAATAPLPPMLSEFLFAGFLCRQPVELVKAKTVGLEVPARAEFVLEGYVEPGELRREGPFGDHTGYYSLDDDYPVFHVQCVTRKREPLYRHRADLPTVATSAGTGDRRYEPAA